MRLFPLETFEFFGNDSLASSNPCLNLQPPE
jgi:hypothetical protein